MPVFLNTRFCLRHNRPIVVKIYFSAISYWCNKLGLPNASYWCKTLYGTSRLCDIYATVARIGRKCAGQLTRRQFFDYLTSELTSDFVLNAMLGFFERIRDYSALGFHITQPIPEPVMQAYQALLPLKVNLEMS